MTASGRFRNCGAITTNTLNSAASTGSRHSSQLEPVQHLPLAPTPCGHQDSSFSKFEGSPLRARRSALFSPHGRTVFSLVIYSARNLGNRGVDPGHGPARTGRAPARLEPETVRWPSQAWSSPCRVRPDRQLPVQRRRGRRAALVGSSSSGFQLVGLSQRRGPSLGVLGASLAGSGQKRRRNE